MSEIYTAMAAYWQIPREEAKTRVLSLVEPALREAYSDGYLAGVSDSQEEAK